MHALRLHDPVRSNSVRLRADCHVEDFPPDHVLVFTERGHQVLHGKAFVALLPLIDGTRGVDALAMAVADHVGFPEAYYALSYLREQGLLRPASGVAADSPMLAWCDSANLDPAQLAAAGSTFGMSAAAMRSRSATRWPRCRSTVPRRIRTCSSS